MMDAVPGHPSRTLIGRDVELTEIASLLGVRPRAEEGPGSDQPHAVLLSGDAGVGKTRLLTELRDLANTDGWQVFAGHCLDFGDSALPYLPFSEVLGRMATALPDVVDTATGHHPALTRLQPGRRILSSHEEGESSALDRADLFEAVHELLDEAAAKAPVLLVVEDTHWADQSTRDMLSFLFSRPFEASVAVVASYRSDDLHRRHPLRAQVAEWSRIRGVERLQLQPLEAPDVRTLISELHPAPLAPEAVAGIVDRAEGNAFFVEELVGATAVPGRWVSAELADVLLVRLDRLDDTARQVARAASVAGRRVSHDMLAAAAGLAAGDLDAGLRGAVETNVLVADERGYAFRHALLGEAVYDDLLPGERVRLHAAYAEALSSGAASGTAAELARHARLALDLVTALTAAVEAGDEASAVGGPDEAAHHYQQALELMADPERARDADVDLSKLVVKAVESLTASGHPIRGAALAQEQLERMPDDAPGEWRARMLAARADALVMTETQEDPAAVSAEALALVPDGFPQLRVKVLALHARILSAMGRDREAEAIGLEALEMAEKHDLTELASDAITTLSGLKRTGPKEGLREALTEAVARAEAAGAIEAELRGRVLLGRSYQDWAEFAETERWFRSAIDRGQAAGLPWAPWSFDARWQLAWVHRTRGEWDEVLALTDVAGQEPPPLARALLDTLSGTVALARGEDVRSLLADLRRYWHKEGLVAIHASPMEMELAGRRGDAAGVLTSYDDAVATMTKIWHPWFSARIRLAAVAIGELARVMPQLSAAERPTYLEHAERLRADGHTVLERYTDSKDSWGPEGQAWFKRVDAETLRVQWLAGLEPPEVDVLVSTWQEAVSLTEDFGDVYELVRVRVALAGIQRAAGDTAAARELGDLARETAHALEAQPLLDDLRALGSTPARAAGASDSLTPREQEILGLVAEGRSNGEIGRQLFISTKTVSVHVSNILAKLGAVGRTEAAAIARRRGLLD
jgi:DNA-binding CsgD family transcriptional regulator/tetratricopeptide (TPR) repeat protein